MFCSEDIRRSIALKLRIGRKIPKIDDFGPRFVGEGISQIFDTHFQMALTSEHVAAFD